MTAEAFFAEFLEKTGRPKDTPCLESFYFDLTEEWANKLLELVLAGKKTATSSSVLSYDVEKGERMPQKGDLSVVTDFAGNPRCVIETTSVTVLPFSEITWEQCRHEGEDMTLESWQRSHIHFFTKEGKLLGYTFSPDMPVAFERFRVVYP